MKTRYKKLYEIEAANYKTYSIIAYTPSGAKAKLYDKYGSLLALSISRGKAVLPKNIIYETASFRKTEVMTAAQKLARKFAAEFNVVTLDSGKFALENIGVLEGAQ